jgi:NTP pyrophosphatase (non-canonical NTP hydrolase)
MDVKAVQAELARFAAERGWDDTQTPKNLAMALAIEASVVLELFKWQRDGVPGATEGERVREAASDAIADVVLQALRLADRLGVDVDRAVAGRLARNAVKYPVALSDAPEDESEVEILEVGLDEVPGDATDAEQAAEDAPLPEPAVAREWAPDAPSPAIRAAEADAPLDSGLADVARPTAYPPAASAAGVHTPADVPPPADAERRDSSSSREPERETTRTELPARDPVAEKAPSSLAPPPPPAKVEAPPPPPRVEAPPPSPQFEAPPPKVDAPRAPARIDAPPASASEAPSVQAGREPRARDANEAAPLSPAAAMSKESIEPERGAEHLFVTPLTLPTQPPPSTSEAAAPGDRYPNLDPDTALALAKSIAKKLDQARSRHPLLRELHDELETLKRSLYAPSVKRAWVAGSLKTVRGMLEQATSEPFGEEIDATGHIVKVDRLLKE